MNVITGNPLLAFPELPPLDAVRAEHVKPAIGTLVADARATIERVAADVAAPTWQNLVEPLADALDRLDRAWSIVNYLNAVVSTPAMRDAYHDNLPEVTALFTDLGQDERIYRRYKGLRAAAAFGALAAAEQRVIDNELRDFRLGGAELDDAGKARFKEIQQALAELSAKFDDNVLDATNAWSLVVDDAGELAGVPADVVAAARREAEDEGRAGFKLTLRSPCYFPVMQYADNRALRAALHRAYVTRASELGASPQWDNTGIIARTLALRTEEARLLGFASYAELSLVPKMAESPADVLAFLRDLAARAQPFGDRDYRELSTFAADKLGLPALEPWDIAWASEKLKLSRFAFSDEDVKQYFPAPNVIAGLFRVVETLYDVRIGEASAPAWHDTVRFFAIRDRAGAIVGHFFMDLYARASKQGGAWMDDPVNRRRLAGGVQDPVAFLTCNFSAPAEGRPALFTHDEVITLFHEFGHGLHLLLTRVDTPGASGLQGVEWDAVELPSQFMENYCWEWDVVRDMSAHVDSGKRCRARCSTRCSRHAISRAVSRCCARWSSASSTCCCTAPTIPPAAPAASARPPRSSARCAPTCASCRSPTTTAASIRSGISSPAAMRLGTTATSGRKCSPPTPSACSRRPGSCPRPRARDSATRCWRVAAAVLRWSRSSPFAGGLPKSTRFCGIMP